MPHFIVLLLLLTAGVCFLLSFLPPFRANQTSLWVAALVCAVIAILLQLFVFHGGTALALEWVMRKRGELEWCEGCD